MKRIFPPEWRTQNRAKRRFYAKYMGWLEKGGFLIVAAVFVGFIFAFNYPVEDVIKADGVQVVAKTTGVKAADLTLVTTRYVTDFQPVKAGQKVAQVLVGAADVRKYQFIQTQPLGGLVKFNYKDIKAPADGILKGLSAGGVAEQGEDVIQVMDYSKLEIKASLEGQTVAKAEAGQKARLTSLNLPSASMTLFRGSAGGEDIISGQLIGDEARKLLAEAFKGQKLTARDEIPLEAGEIKQIQIDAKMQWKDGGASQGQMLDPSSRAQFPAEVIAGTHEVTVQATQLPTSIKSQLEELIRSRVTGRIVTLPSGGSKALGRISELGVIVQMSASQAKEAKSSLPGAVLAHKYTASLRLTNPPPYLSEAVLRADREGKAVTARAEVVTGTRPIALLLLRKS